MEEMMKIQNTTCLPKRFRHQQQQPQPRLGMHTDSHVISKFTMKPKIRIVHIYAPEIIKTDAANFRELVQRLTGKPSPSDRNKKSSSSKKRPAARSSSSADTSSDHVNGNYHHHVGHEVSTTPNLFYNNLQTTIANTTDESSSGLQSSDYGSHGSVLKEEEEVIWGGDKGFFTDFEGLIRGIGLPTHLDMFGDTTTSTYDRSYAVYP
ncbi:VQ motif-containing protein 17-like [Papaver somniferum]|uniref:VQ motif-containing protein 17-like n=1 Tax=Papaver somniferum TaxID=3469 RepID=UPI000E6FC76B|nr:VQ motif-containing protein 17-like [Papaver somniferum]